MNKIEVGYKFIDDYSGQEWKTVRLIPEPEMFAGQWECAETFTGDDGIWDAEAIEECQPSIVVALDTPIKSNGGATGYYDFPAGFTTLNDLIEYKNMPFWLGNIFKAVFRFGEKDVATKEYDLNKIIYFAGRGLGVLRKGKE